MRFANRLSLLRASVAELVDALDSKSSSFGSAGSTPARGTIGLGVISGRTVLVQRKLIILFLAISGGNAEQWFVIFCLALASGFASGSFPLVNATPAFHNAPESAEYTRPESPQPADLRRLEESQNRLCEGIADRIGRSGLVIFFIHGIRTYMSGKGNCYDNARVETFFPSLKAEMIWRQMGNRT